MVALANHQSIGKAVLGVIMGARYPGFLVVRVSIEPLLATLDGPKIMCRQQPV
jgi:hypothetical protein